MSYLVSTVTTSGRPTAVIARETTWEAFAGLWPDLLAAVWAALRTSDAVKPGRNVMLFRDDVPHVEVGVEVDAPFADFAGIVSSELPAGRAALTVHRGPYSDLASAHRPVVEWCAHQALERAGPRWEIYGHMREGGADQAVEVYHLLA